MASVVTVDIGLKKMAKTISGTSIQYGSIMFKSVRPSSIGMSHFWVTFHLSLWPFPISVKKTTKMERTLKI